MPKKDKRPTRIYPDSRSTFTNSTMNQTEKSTSKLVKEKISHPLVQQENKRRNNNTL